jgi:hypothetical protein
VVVSGREGYEQDVAVKAMHNEPGRCKLHKKLVGDLASAGFEASCHTPPAGVIFRRPTLTGPRPGKLAWPEGRLRDGARSASSEYPENRKLRKRVP